MSAFFSTSEDDIEKMRQSMMTSNGGFELKQVNMAVYLTRDSYLKNLYQTHP